MVGCPTCGAALRFDIASQKMACDHCGNLFETQKLSDNSSRDDARSSQFDSYVYICPSCGAELLTTDKNDAVGFCQYCGGASMIYEKMRQEWKPDYIIPFKVTKEDCKKAYCKEVRRHPFVSRKYSKSDLSSAFRLSPGGSTFPSIHTKSYTTTLWVTQTSRWKAIPATRP